MQVKPLSGAIGAEISGVDLATADTVIVYPKLRELLVEHEVIFLRDQQISPGQHRALAAFFGPLQTHPAYSTLTGFPEITILESTADKPTKIEVWHSDMTFRAHPPMATVLRAKVVPEKGGDTLFASMSAAYDALSPALKTFLDGLEAEHSFEHGFQESLAEAGGRERLAAALSDNPPVRHPVIRTHPENGKKIIFVNALFTTHIVGLAKNESTAVLEFLYEHCEQAEFTCRLSWQPDSIAIWDNRSTHHKPVNDYFPAHRMMQRIVIDGDKPY